MGASDEPCLSRKRSGGLGVEGRIFPELGSSAVHGGNRTKCVYACSALFELFLTTLQCKISPGVGV